MSAASSLPEDFSIIRAVLDDIVTTAVSAISGTAGDAVCVHSATPKSSISLSKMKFDNLCDIEFGIEALEVDGPADAWLVEAQPRASESADGGGMFLKGPSWREFISRMKQPAAKGQLAEPASQAIRVPDVLGATDCAGLHGTGSKGQQGGKFGSAVHADAAAAASSAITSSDSSYLHRHQQQTKANNTDSSQSAICTPASLTPHTPPAKAATAGQALSAERVTQSQRSYASQGQARAQQLSQSSGMMPATDDGAAAIQPAAELRAAAAGHDADPAAAAAAAKAGRAVTDDGSLGGVAAQPGSSGASDSNETSAAWMASLRKDSVGRRPSHSYRRSQSLGGASPVQSYNASKLGKTQSAKPIASPPMRTPPATSRASSSKVFNLFAASNASSSSDLGIRPSSSKALNPADSPVGGSSNASSRSNSSRVGSSKYSLRAPQPTSPPAVSTEHIKSPTSSSKQFKYPQRPATNAPAAKAAAAPAGGTAAAKSPAGGAAASTSALSAANKASKQQRKEPASSTAVGESAATIATRPAAFAVGAAADKPAATMGNQADTLGDSSSKAATAAAAPAAAARRPENDPLQESLLQGQPDQDLLATDPATVELYMAQYKDVMQMMDMAYAYDAAKAPAAAGPAATAANRAAADGNKFASQKQQQQQQQLLNELLGPEEQQQQQQQQQQQGQHVAGLQLQQQQQQRHLCLQQNQQAEAIELILQREQPSIVTRHSGQHIDVEPIAAPLTGQKCESHDSEGMHSVPDDMAVGHWGSAEMQVVPAGTQPRQAAEAVLQAAQFGGQLGQIVNAVGEGPAAAGIQPVDLATPTAAHSVQSVASSAAGTAQANPLEQQHGRIVPTAEPATAGTAINKAEREVAQPVCGCHCVIV